MSFFPLSYYLWSSLANSVTGAFGAILILANNRRSIKNITYALHLVPLSAWALFYFLWQRADNAHTALLYTRLFSVFAIWIAPLHLNFVLVAFDMMTPARKRFMTVYYAVLFLLVLATPFAITIPRVEPRLIFPYWPVPGPLFHFHALNFLVGGGYTQYLIFKLRARSTSALTRNTMNWFVLLTMIGYLGGATNFPLWYNIPVAPVTNGAISVYTVLITVLYFKLGFLDLQHFILDAFARLTSSILIGLVFVLALLPFTGLHPWLIGILLVPLIISVFYEPLFRLTRRLLAQTRLGAGAATSQKITQTLEQVRESTFTYDDLARNLVASVKNVLPVELAAVYLLDAQVKSYVLRAQAGMQDPRVSNLKLNRSLLAVPETDPLIQLLDQQKNIVIREVFLAEHETSSAVRPVVTSMEQREAEVCVPIILTDKLRGFIIAGKKTNQQLFTSDELDILQTLRHMAEDVMRYVIGMETELKNTSLYSHDMDNDVRSVQQTLEFLLSPLSVNQPKEKLTNLIERAKDVGERVRYRLQINRDRSALIMKSIRGEYERKILDFRPVLEAACNAFELSTQNSSVQFTHQIPAHPLPVLGNEDDLVRVLSNLLSNASRYVASSQGRIDLSATEQDGAVRIEVKDNGDGIPVEDIEAIWEIGWQAKNSKKGAAGLGLPIARQIIELHKGTIGASSEGRGKGTCFTISLPLIKSA